MNIDDQLNSNEDISSSRLIEEISILNDFSELLNEPKKTTFDGYISVDEIYCLLKFKDKKAGEELQSLVKTIQCDGIPETYESRKSNQWRYMNIFNIGGGTVRLGIGLNNISGAIAINKGCIRFNPNKVKDCKELSLLFEKISRFIKSVELKTYDIAIDIPIERSCVRMARDKRGYEYWNHGRGITEYLGSRGKSNRVKLYDKTKELQHQQGISIKESITRLELTCDSNWTAKKIFNSFPMVYAWNDDRYDEDTRAFVKAIGLLAALAIQHEEQIDFALDMLPKTTRNKVMEYLASPCIDIDISDIEYARDKAYKWLDRIRNGK